MAPSTGAAVSWASAAWLRRDGIALGALERFVVGVRGKWRQLFASAWRRVRKRNELVCEIAHQASHDELTGLDQPARDRAQADRALETAHGGGSGHALCFIDLDQFVGGNDNQGLPRPVDRFPARTRLHVAAADWLGWLGDEFAVLLHRH